MAWYLAVLLVALCPAASGEVCLVRDGKPQAQIVVAQDPPRTTRLAARELQTYVEKISGAKLPVETTPAAEVPVTVYVGRSRHTEKLGLTAEGLEDGAYRIVSGDDWLVLVGDDTDFAPVEPWPRGYQDLRSGKMQRAWEAITGAHWGYPFSQLHKHYSGPNALFGTPNEQREDEDGNIHVWTYDERGSFNAVCGFLRDLGVRWYMPGEIGEIVPRMDTIPLPQVDRTVRPDFPLRCLNFRAGLYGRDAMMWGFRLGTRQPFGRQAAHGLHHMTHNEHTLANHPDWFALYGGKRQNQLGQRHNQLCYSNEELFREAVRFAQAQFDHYDMDVVSIMPPDGFTAMCQCKLCEGKDSPELGERGRLSNYVWDFVNRVAKEVGKSHPGKLISCCAYGIYTEPPDNLDKLEPNVQVIIVGGRRPTSPDREDLRRLREAWAKKTDRPLEIFENYPFTGRGFYLPAYIPRVMGESINATKGLSRGEDIWLTMDFSDKAIGYNHFLIYFTARMYWGGTEQDAVALFDEYVRKLYGPAASRMRVFFAYCQDNWRAMETDGDKAKRALELFAAAKASTDEASIYGRRLKLIDNYLNGLRSKCKQLAQKRGPVPQLRLVGDPRGEIVIDGKLDEPLWQNCPVASTGRLRELQTGRQPIFGTTFKATWVGHNLYFALRCEETASPASVPQASSLPQQNAPVPQASSLPQQSAPVPPASLNIATTKDGDRAIWYGDCIEILLETESHSYYQLVVNPAGALVDLDRGADRAHWFGWSSQAEVATQVADDHWTVEIRIPVTRDENDPLHQVIGRRPTQSLPWHLNVCRQRIRENGEEYSAFSPTGTKGFHEKMKFAHFYAGRSHRFPADPTVTDYLIASRATADLVRSRKLDEALTAYVALSTGEDLTDFQKSDALAHAARCARNLRDYDRAAKLAKQIPIEAVANTVVMENLLAQRKPDVIIDQFGDEDLTQYPFWQIGPAAFARGRAHLALKAGDKAEADLLLALQYTADPRTRTSILLNLGTNRETSLKDDAAAFEAYRLNFQGKTRLAADEFRSVLNAARVLTRQGKFEEALATLDRLDVGKLRDYWRGAMMLARGETLEAAGRKEEAVAVYRAVVADASAEAGHRKMAEDRIAASKEA